MDRRLLALALPLLASTALAATANDYYGKWSKGDCGEEYVVFAEGKVTQFSKNFQAVEGGAAPARPAAAKPPEAPKPPAAPKVVAQAPAKSAEPAKPAADAPASMSDEPTRPATARRLVDPASPPAPRNPATARKVTETPAPQANKPAQTGTKSMDVPATIKIDGDRLSVETQEKGRKPRRELYAMADKDTLILDQTFVDGRRIPPITRDQITYRRCK